MRSHRLVPLVAASLVLAAVPLTVQTVVGSPAAMALGGLDDASSAAWSVKCSYTQTAKVDPIVSWGQTSAHWHQFAGTPGVTSTTNPAALRSSSTFTCGPSI